VLWAITRALRDLWAAQRDPQRSGARAGPRQEAALRRGVQRAARLQFPLLTARAARVDKMVKGQLVGDPWDEMLLLIAEFCGRAPALGPSSAA